MSTIHLDGRTLEGGGQLLRIALGLSALTGVPIHVTHIRGNRGAGKAGGLKAAHLAAASWLAKTTAATTTGLELRSTELVLKPTRRMHSQDVWKEVYEEGRLIRRETTIAMSTNGSTLLILQAIFPYLLFTPSSVPLRITIEGGTNVTSSPSIEYISQVFLPLISHKLHVAPVRVVIHRRGWCFGRKEVGRVSFDVEPLRKGTIQPAFQITDRGKVEKVHVSVIAPSDGTREQIKAEVLKQLNEISSGVDLQWIVDEDSGSKQRMYLLLVVEMSSGFRVGKDCLLGLKSPKKSHRKNGNHVEDECRKLVSKVVEDMRKELSWEGCVDEYMEDQLVIFQALACGRSEVDAGKDREASLHTKTARWVATRILGTSFEGGRCDGVGFRVNESWPEGENGGMMQPRQEESC